MQQATHVATHPTHPTYPQSVCEAFEARYVATYLEALQHMANASTYVAT